MSIVHLASFKYKARDGNNCFRPVLRDVVEGELQQCLVAIGRLVDCISGADEE